MSRVCMCEGVHMCVMACEGRTHARHTTRAAATTCYFSTAGGRSEASPHSHLPASYMTLALPGLSPSKMQPPFSGRHAGRAATTTTSQQRRYSTHAARGASCTAAAQQHQHYEHTAHSGGGTAVVLAASVLTCHFGHHLLTPGYYLPYLHLPHR